MLLLIDFSVAFSISVEIISYSFAKLNARNVTFRETSPVKPTVVLETGNSA